MATKNVRLHEHVLIYIYVLWLDLIILMLRLICFVRSDDINSYDKSSWFALFFFLQDPFIFLRALYIMYPALV